MDLVKKEIEDYTQRLTSAEEVGNRSEEGAANASLGKAYYSLGKFHEAIECHKQHLNIARELGQRDEEGRAYGNLGCAYHSLGNFNQALEYHKQHLSIAKELGQRDVQVTAYCNIGTAYNDLNDPKQAIEYHKQSLRIAKEMGLRDAEGDALSRLGNDYYSFGESKQAIECHMKYLSMAKELGKTECEGVAYCNLGNAFYGLGDYKQAMEYHKKSLSFAKELGNKDLESTVYGNLGNVYNCLGDFKQSLEYHKKALSIAKELGKRCAEGRIYGYLGDAYQRLDDVRQAIEYLKKHLSIAKDLGQRHNEGVDYRRLGIAYGSCGDYKKAIEYHKQNLSIANELEKKDEEKRAYGNLGIVHYKIGDFRLAIEYYKKSLCIAKELGNRYEEAVAYCNLGNAYHALRDFKHAMEYHKRDLSISKELGKRDGEGIAYGNLGDVHYSLGDFKRAIEYQRQCLNIARELGQRELVGNTCCNLGDSYGRLGDFKLAIDFHEEALSIARELGYRHREGLACYRLGGDFELSGSLHEALGYYRSSVEVLNGIRSLFQSEDSLKITFRNTCHNYYTALWRTLVKLSKTGEALCVAEEGRGQALVDLMKLQYGCELLAPGSPDLNVTTFHNTSTQMVFIALERGNIHLWLLGKQGHVQFRQKEIPEKDLKDANTFLGDLRRAFIRENQIYGRVTCENRSLDELREDAPQGESFLEDTVKTTISENNSLRRFYDYIVGPISDLLRGDELVIVPDGPLCLAPYAAFLDDKSRYLSDSFRVRVLPSLTSLKMIEDSPDEYHRKSGVLLVGDPCIDEVTNIFGKPIFTPLPFTREEVKMIGDMLDTTPLVGREATKDEVLRRLGSVALVHIAAHGRMETGEIALAPNPERASDFPEEKDYRLTIADVQAVQLRARLVVLSCCHSAQGKVTAEGVVGIARAFLGAGARSVLVSLWAIDDEATMEFMKSFYKHLKDGCSASVALNQAMRSLRGSEKFCAVKHWAPFLLIGDDVTIQFDENHDAHCE